MLVGLFLAKLAMAIVPSAVYLPQLLEIRRNPECLFSLNVPLILIVSSVLRIQFWFLQPFDVALLAQSILMISVQLLILYTIIHPREDIEYHQLQQESLEDKRSFRNYLLYLTIFAILTIALTITSHLMEWRVYGTVLGFLALAIESTLPMPQAWNNYVHQSTNGLRTELIIAWTLGDAWKTIYFNYSSSPKPFVMCGMIQLSVDLVIAGQFIKYSENK